MLSLGTDHIFLHMEYPCHGIITIEIPHINIGNEVVPLYQLKTTMMWILEWWIIMCLRLNIFFYMLLWIDPIVILILFLGRIIYAKESNYFVYKVLLHVFDILLTSYFLSISLISYFVGRFDLISSLKFCNYNFLAIFRIPTFFSMVVSILDIFSSNLATLNSTYSFSYCVLCSQQCGKEYPYTTWSRGIEG